MNEWLAGAEAACNEAVEGGPTADRLLQIAQVHALIAIAQEIAGIRELIVMTEEAPLEEVDDGDDLS